MTVRLTDASFKSWRWFYLLTLFLRFESSQTASGVEGTREKLSAAILLVGQLFPATPSFRSSEASLVKRFPCQNINTENRCHDGA